MSIKSLRRWCVPIGVATLLAVIIAIGIHGVVEDAVQHRDSFSRLNMGGVGKGDSAGRGEIDLEGISGSRIGIWRASGRYLVESRGFGIGTENYGAYQVREHSNFPHAHSLYLSIIGDYGVVGVCILLWIAVVIGGKLRRIYAQDESDRTMVAKALTGGLVAMGIHSAFDFHHNLPFFWCYLGLFMAALCLAERGECDVQVQEGVGV